MSPTFHSLGVPNYRSYASGAIVSNVGTWMGRVAQDWLVLTVLTDHSASALGIVTGLQFLPFLVLAPWAGMIADRLPQAAILLFATQTALLVTALRWPSSPRPASSSCGTSTRSPCSRGSPPRSTTRRGRPSSPRWSTTTTCPTPSPSTARRSTSAGSSVRASPASSSLASASHRRSSSTPSTFLFVLARAAAHATPGAARRRPEPGARARSARACATSARRPDLMLIMALVFVLGTFGMNFQMTMALMATRSSTRARGSTACSARSWRSARSPRRCSRPGGPAPPAGLLVVRSRGSPSRPPCSRRPRRYELFAIYLVPTGLAALTALTTANAMVQMSVAPVMRGRVMALYMAIFMGGTPVGAPDDRLDRRRLGRPLDHRASAPSRWGSASPRWPSGSRVGRMWR